MNILDFFFPKFCVNCKKEGAYVCKECLDFFLEAELICPICQNFSGKGETHKNCFSSGGLDGLVSVWEYNGVVEKMIKRMKKGTYDVGPKMARLALSVIVEDPYRFSGFLSFLFSEGTFITYIPSHKKKKRKKGFEESEIIAGEISRLSGVPARSFLLKEKETAPREELSLEERAKCDFKGVFSSLKVEGKKIVVVDDFWGSGTTLKECCRSLKEKGANSVWGFTLAKIA